MQVHATVRGPVIAGQHGTVNVDGVRSAGTTTMLMLRYLQAADPHLPGVPFLAAADPAAAWLTDLQPAPGTAFPRPPGQL